MPLDIQPQFLGAIAYARRRPRDGRSFNRAEARPAAALRRGSRRPRSTLAAATSLVVTELVAGVATCVAAARREAVALPDLRRLGRWTGLLPLWSGLHRARERARVEAAWMTVDERTLRDIGIPPRPFRGRARSWNYWCC